MEARGERATARAKPEILPPEKRRVLELEGGVRVEVIAEGQGSIVAPGDEVALSMTLSYVPTLQPTEPEAVPVEAIEDAESEKPKSKSKRGTDKKSADAPTETAKSDAASDAKPVEIAGTSVEGSVAPTATTDEKSKGDVAKPETDAARTENAAPATDPAGAEVRGEQEVDVAQPEPSETDPAQAKPLDSATDANAATDAATDAAPTATAATNAAPVATVPPSAPGDDASASEPIGTAPAPAPLAALLEPVIVLSTKTLGMPIRGRVGVEGGLMPGLSRALVGLRAGTVAEIMLPPESAYGAGGLPSAGIPPGTLLLAHIEIREVRR